MFEAVPKAQLEIHTGMMASAILSDTISCEKLAVESSDGLDESLDSLVRKGMPPVSGASLAEARSEEGELTSAIAQ